MKEKTEHSLWRTSMMLLGILMIGIGVAFYRMSSFGVDAFSSMNLGISGFLDMSFGNWQLIANSIVLVGVWFTARECIGPGTLVNMVFVGYIADFICWLFLGKLGMAAGLTVRALFLLLGTMLLSFGCACYMEADMGIAPYDSVAPIIMKYAEGRVSFRFARVASDLAVILTGILFCIMGGNSLWGIVGLGTVVNACCNGPLIQFFRERLQKGSQ